MKEQAPVILGTTNEVIPTLWGKATILARLHAKHREVREEFTSLREALSEGRISWEECREKEKELDACIQPYLDALNSYPDD